MGGLTRRRRRRRRRSSRRATTRASARPTSATAWRRRPMSTAAAGRRSTCGATTARHAHRREGRSSRSRPTARCSRPTRGCAAWSRPITATPRSRRRWPASTGREAAVRRTSSGRRAVAMAGERRRDPDRLRVRRGRRSFELDLRVDRVAAMAAERATRLLGASQPTTRRLPVILDPLVTASVLVADRQRAQRRGDAAGPLDVRGSGRRDGRRARRHARRRPHDPRGVRRGRRTTARACPPGASPLIGDGVLHGFLHNVYTARRSGSRTTGSAVRGGYASTPGVGARALHLQPGVRSPEEILASLPEALYVQSVTRPALRDQPGERRLLRGRRGADGARRRSSPSRCGRSRSRRRCRGCSSTCSRSAPISPGCRAAPPGSPSSSTA